jgi:hypothetical protein
MAESLGVCKAQVERIDFVEGTGSFKNRNFLQNFFFKKMKEEALSNLCD